MAVQYCLDHVRYALHGQHMTNSPDLTDPEWLPTEEEEAEIVGAMAKSVAWEKAMAVRGVRVLALGLTPEQEEVAIEAWTNRGAARTGQEV